MPPRMLSVEGVMGLRSWRYADGKANLRAVVAASSSIADGVASALKPRRTRISPYPAAATARAKRISKTAFQGFMSTSPVPWHEPTVQRQPWQPLDGRQLYRRLRRLLLTGVAVEKLLPAKFAKMKSRQEALQATFSGRLDTFYPPNFACLERKRSFSTATGDSAQNPLRRSMSVIGINEMVRRRVR